MEAGSGKLRWWFAANEHVTSKVWPLSAIKHIYGFKCDKLKCSNKYHKKYFLSRANAQKVLFGIFIRAL